MYVFMSLKDSTIRIMYNIQSKLVKLAHAQGFRVGGDYALYVLGVKARCLPRMHQLRLYGTALDIDKLIKTFDVLYGVDILQKDMKPFVHKIYFKLHPPYEKIHVYYTNVRDEFSFSKDAVVLSPDGIEVFHTASVLGSRSMQTIEMTKKMQMSLLHHGSVVSESYFASWDYIASQMDYVKCGWRIRPGDKWSVYASDSEQCAICQNALDDIFCVKTVCQHTFHLECLKQWVVNGETCARCPMCRSSRLILYENGVP